LQRAELFENQEPQNDTGPSGTEEVLQPVPQAHAAQRSEVKAIVSLKHFVIESLEEMTQYLNDSRSQ
jgi:hypothetical protein